MRGREGCHDEMSDLDGFGERMMYVQSGGESKRVSGSFGRVNLTISGTDGCDPTHVIVMLVGDQYTSDLLECGIALFQRLLEESRA